MAESQGLLVVNQNAPQIGARTSSGDSSQISRFSALTGYADILFRHLGLIVTVAFVVTALTAIYSFKVRPVFRATARLEIESETPLIQSLTDLFRSSAPIDEETFLSTQVDVLQSDNLAWRTIQQLGLSKEPEFQEAARGVRTKVNSATALQTALTNVFKKNLIVERSKDTRMLQVHYEDFDPQVAASVANALIDNYIEYSFRLKYDATRQATAWMEQQLDDLKNKVEKSQQALVDYETRNSMINVGDKESVSEQKLADLSKDLTEAQDDRVKRQSIDNLVNADPTRVRFVAQSPLLQKLTDSEAELGTQYAEASQAYGPNFPKVKRLQAQLEEVRQLITNEQKRIVESINNDYVTARGREQLLTQAVVNQKAEVARFNELSIQHNLLKRDFESNQTLYDSLMQRMKDATISAGLRATNIHMIDRALPPTSPARPRKVRNILIGSMAGLILGFLAALGREAMDYTIKGAEEIELLTGMPTLSIIPDATSGRRLLPYGKRSEPKMLAGDRIQGTVSTTLIHHPGSAIAESYRALRTSILLSQPDRPPQILLVTSANPSEGKTCTAVNLALALAQKSGRVLLIDGDFRRPGVAKSLGIAGKPGLSEVLTGSADISEAAIPFPELPALSILPTGSHPPNPAELLSSTAMMSLIKDLRSRYTSIVIDSPPVLLITDATILASMVDGVVMVAASEITPRPALVRAYRVINLAGGKVLGAVLNKVDSRRDGYYGHYRYYYRSYYDSYYTKS
ncbi:MAG: polysaccharide biosynthesis tyrosine autokinase [Bryobacteraceae bacterium]